MNHTSMLDPGVAAWAYPGHPIAKNSLANFWVYKQFFLVSRAILVSRKTEKIKSGVQEMVRPNA